VITGYLTESNGRWIARLVYADGGKRRERKRTLGRVHHGRGRPKAGAIPRRVALSLLAEAQRELEADLARPRTAVTSPVEAPPPAPPRRPVEELSAPPRRADANRSLKRATVVLVALGIPLLVMFAALRILPDALWFHELGELDVFVRIQSTRALLFLLAGGAAGFVLWLNVVVALRRTELPRSRAIAAIAMGASLITASYFASSAAGHWETFLLWWHRQSFGVRDPVHGRDVGFFIFSLPFERAVSAFLLGLLGVTAVYVVVVYRVGGAIRLRPLRVTRAAQVHLVRLVAVFLLVVAWRVQIERYVLELGQPSPRDPNSVAGAGYLDTHVRSPLLEAGSIVAVVLAVACFAAPQLTRPRARIMIAVPAGLALVLAVGAAIAPPIVQRFVVAPSELSRESPFLARSIGATRAGLGLEAIDVKGYASTGALSATAVAHAHSRLAKVEIWDASLLRARARQLVTDTPYFDPERPILDVRRRRLTLASTRELNLRSVRALADDWDNEHLAYTHGLGEIRFSGSEIDANRQPRAVDSGLGLSQPRIYFGNPPGAGGKRGRDTTLAPRSAASPWVVVNTRRPEVDIPGRSYHYDGTGGVALSSWIRRAAFALELSNKALLLSKSITPKSRILVHADVPDRLRTLAPFIQWDGHPVPLTLNGRIVYFVDGYTTSVDYPYAEHAELGGARVNYARAAVSATVDAFSGKVTLYLTDPSDPIARAWAAAFPKLFHDEDEMPAELRARRRYPRALFTTQASAYERFHTTQPTSFASGADAWSRPIALAGPVDVAGNVDFDESDEDDLRLTMRPGYLYSTPPGQHRSRLLIETYFSPRRGQNLVGTLTGWVDEHGQARLVARSLPHDPVTLGPAQVSRQVFATPRVNRLLGLSNLELRDLNRSSLDTVVLGQPHVLFLRGGPIQIQSLYEGSRGPGAARLIGVTAFLNGHAGLGSTIEAAVRQALHKPPRIRIAQPRGRISIGEPVDLDLVATNTRQAVVTILSPGRTARGTVAFKGGKGTFRWVPSQRGRADVRAEAVGLDGSHVAARTAFPVLSRAPNVRVAKVLTRAVVGRSVRILFRVRDGVGAMAQVSSHDGVEFTRKYLLHRGTGVLEWTPSRAGGYVLRVRAAGRDGQSSSDSARIEVRPAPRVATSPTVTLLKTPHAAQVGRSYEIVFRADGCGEAVARIAGAGEQRSVWRFRCGTQALRFTWAPTRAGHDLLTVSARGKRGVTSTAIPLRAEGRS
jgi:uncharacterized membrane protein (UPF0182 family)